MLQNKPRGNILICEYERKKIRSIKYCLWQQIVDHWWQKISGTYIYGLCFLKVIKKSRIIQTCSGEIKGWISYEVIYYECTFVSWTSPVIIWVCCCTHQKVMMEMFNTQRCIHNKLTTIFFCKKKHLKTYS